MTIRPILTGLALLFPVFLVAAAVLTYAVNLPYWDDYIVHEHLMYIKSVNVPLQKVRHLFDQHWEHRIVWTRSIFFLYYKLTGSLNYYGLTLLGSGGLLLLLLLFFLAFRRTRLPLYYFLPVPFLIATLQSHENLIWAMASLQNFYVLVFVLGACYGLANRSRIGFGIAMALAVLASFTSGNGFLVFPAGAAVLLLRRHYRQLGIWLLTGALSVIGYFWTYNRINFFPAPDLFPVTEWIKGFFVFLGGFADTYPYTTPYAIGYTNRVWLTVLVGALAAAFAGYHLLRLLVSSPLVRERPRVAERPFWNDFFVSAALFLLATAVMTVYARVGFGGAAYLLQGRYKVYSPLFLSLCYLYGLTLEREPRRLNRQVLVAALLVIPTSLYASYQCLEGMVHQHRRANAYFLNWLIHTPEAQRKAMLYVYHLTDTPGMTADTARLHAPESRFATETIRLDSLYEDRYFFNLYQRNAVNPDLRRPDEGSYMVLMGSNGNHIFAARPLRPGALEPEPRPSGQYFGNQLLAQVQKEALPPGTYRVGLVSYQAGKARFSLTPHLIHHRPNP